MTDSAAQEPLELSIVMPCLDEAETVAACVAKAVRFLRDTQEEQGCWFGRWGVNYVYGTWQVLTGLRLVGQRMDHRRSQYANNSANGGRASEYISSHG